MLLLFYFYLILFLSVTFSARKDSWHFTFLEKMSCKGFQGNYAHISVRIYGSGTGKYGEAYVLVGTG
ncbi:hypothetical protein BDZ91DRAFT_722985 [Kalaharituber pfeilii]|nr:hypothetical protein BDZ91DRAFT_722985 [Kalaharituber pfeilii]